VRVAAAGGGKWERAAAAGGHGRGSAATLRRSVRARRRRKVQWRGGGRCGERKWKGEEKNGEGAAPLTKPWSEVRSKKPRLWPSQTCGS
jgi:hypothetical protein